MQPQDSHPFEKEKISKRVNNHMASDNFSAIHRTVQTCLTDRSGVRLAESHASHFSLDYNILKAQLSHYVPVLAFPFPTSSNLIIYYHSNAEDITMLETLCTCLRDSLKATVWAVEYPGYSVYSGKDACAENIKQDAISVVEFIRSIIELPSGNISVIGRSLGSGPAIYLSSLFKFGMVVVVSGFLSIKDVVKDRSTFLSRFIDSYFDNDKLIYLNRSPILLLHGKNDTITNYLHSEKLYEKTTSKAKIVIFDNMPHNDFDFNNCVLQPIKNFQKSLKKNNNQTGNLVQDFGSFWARLLAMCNEVFVRKIIV